MRLLVTGAAGFIGRNLLRALPHDWDITATYRLPGDFLEFLEHEVGARVTPLQVDLAEADQVDRLFSTQARAFDGCVYLAANGDPAVSATRPGFDLRSNTVALVNTFERVTVRRCVFFSSGAVYDGLRGSVTPMSPLSPRLPYGIAKLACEHYLQHFKQLGSIGEVLVVRFFGAFGPYEPDRKIYTRLVRRFALERDPRFAIRGDGSNLIDAMYVDDAIRAIMLLLCGSGSGTADLAAQQPLTVRALVEQAARTFGLTAELTCAGAVPEYIEFWTVDTTMRDRFGFAPQISLHDGLERLAARLARPG